jgi:copper chaperone
MLTFTVPNMTCGHCVRSITQAVQAADPAAQVQADVPAHQVQVETALSHEVVTAVLTEAGYQPA